MAYRKRVGDGRAAGPNYSLSKSGGEFQTESLQKRLNEKYAEDSQRTQTQISHRVLCATFASFALKLFGLRSLFGASEPVEAHFFLQTLQARVEPRRAVFAERAAAEPGEFVRQFARLQQPAVDMPFEMPPVGQCHRHRAAHRAMPAAPSLGHQLYPPGQGPD